MQKPSILKIPIPVPIPQTTIKKQILPVDIKKPHHMPASMLGKTPKVFSSQKYITHPLGNSYTTRKKKNATRLYRAFGAVAMVAVVGIMTSIFYPLVSRGSSKSSGSHASAQSVVPDVWWPVDQAHLTGSHPFKSLVPNRDISSYDMYWQVDGGTLNLMATSLQDYPHKESWVDVSGWNWKGSGPYSVSFVAKSFDGAVIGQAQRAIYVDSANGQITNEIPATQTSAPAVSAPVVNPAPVATLPTPTASTPSLSCNTWGNNVFIGCYYDQMNDTGLAAVRTDPQINFDWGGGSPASTIPSDKFSAAWKGKFDFVDGIYEFNVSSDDGMRIAIDGVTVFNRYYDQAATTLKAKIPLTAGVHAIQVDYYENSGGASAKVSWNLASASSTTTPQAPVLQPTPATPEPGISCPGAVQNAFSGCYYDGVNFSSLKYVKTDTAINFNWGGGSPDGSIGSDNFSVRWKGKFYFEAGSYNFSATADDGVRMYVDNTAIIDKFIDQASTKYTAQKDLSAGQHDITVEYYERGGGANIQVGWEEDVIPAVLLSTPVVTQPVPSGGTTAGWSTVKFYVDPNSNAKNQANAWKSARPQDAALMDKLAQVSNASWFGGWNQDIKNDAKNLVTAASAQGATPIMIAYNIPGRDCGSYSAGGAESVAAYKKWISDMSEGIGNKKAVVVLEPDALAGIDCLSAADKQSRLKLLSYAIGKLKSNSETKVYLDAGNAHWVGVDEMAQRLNSASIDKADGFSLNISNFFTSSDNIAYGSQLSGKVGGKHFIVDTSRNGNGPTSDYQWCNPSGRAVGTMPTTSTGNNLVDALIWGKDPGGSDGTCNGGPSAGTWWPDYALDLMKNAGW